MLEKIERIRAMKAAGRKIAVLTAYDYPMARLLDESGVDIILVGDSLGMVVLGFPDTTSVTMEHMVHHCAAVCRGVKEALVVADLPIGSCDTPEAAVANSRRLIAAGAGAVKIEGPHLAEIRAVVQAGIPLMAHLGMLPQSVREEGGYRVKGKTPEEAAVLVDQARAVEDAGAFSMVLELVRHDVAGDISEAVGIPTIGIGAGPACDGQVLVTHDLIGLFPWFRPRFAKPEADVASQIRAAVTAFRERTQEGAGIPEEGTPQSRGT
jgi:3-methyl-2-oxobutanoate hydroxymethyltransferase